MESLKKRFSEQDLTVGEPWKKILHFSIPLIIGNLAQQLYNTVDAIVVGKYVGDNALSAVGASSPVFFVLMVLFIGLSTGVSIMVSQNYGAKRREDLSYTIGNAISLTAIISVITILLSFVFVSKLLVLLKTPETLRADAETYLRILFYGVPAMAYYNIFSGTLRGLGDSASSLLFILVSTITNILLDIVFVAHFHMGVAGVAWATILAQALSAVLCFIRLRSMQHIFSMGGKYYSIKKRYAREMISLGLPSGATQAIFAMSGMLVQSLVNQFGEMFVAANLMVARVDGFAVMPTFSFGVAMTTFSGQNIGAGKMERLDKGIKQGIKLTLGVAVVMTSLTLIFGGQVMSLFSETEELVRYAWKMMFILAPGYLAFAITQCLSGTMRGAGDTVTPLWISIINTVLIRVPLAYGIAYFTRSIEHPRGLPESIFISLAISWVAGSMINFLFYRYGNWRKKAEKNMKLMQELREGSA